MPFDPTLPRPLPRLKAWQNTGLQNLGILLQDPDAPDTPLLVEVRDQLSFLNKLQSTANRRFATFNIDSPDALTAALTIWCTENPDAVVVSTEAIQGADGTNFYMITYM